jgi:hypothetical protein
MKLQKRSSYEKDEDLINDLVNKELNLKKSKMTDVICSMLNYISMIPTLVYNAIWFILLKSTLNQILNENVLNNVQGCDILYYWSYYAWIWTAINFIKATVLLLCAKFCCGGENDCSLCCVFVKSITTVIPSIVFVLKIPDFVKNYLLFNSNVTNISKIDLSLKTSCDNIANVLNIYYKWEYAYIIFVIFMFCLIPFGGAFLMCCKEMWKSRGYYNKQE